MGEVHFTASLVETLGRIGGATEEPCPRGGGPAGVLRATLAGRRDGSAVQFVKRYDGAVRGYATVLYAGTLSGDGSEIEGSWTVPQSWSGTFLMIRTSGIDAAANANSLAKA